MKANIMKYFEALTERERLIVVTLLLVGSLFFYALLWFGYSSAVESEIATISDQQRMMQKITAMKNIYKASRHTNTSLMDRIKRNKTNINSYISRVAESMNVEINTIKELKPHGKGALRMEKVELSLRRVDLPTLLSFIYALENRRDLVFVETLSIKRRYDKKNYNASIVVATVKEREGK